MSNEQLKTYSSDNQEKEIQQLQQIAQKSIDKLNKLLDLNFDSIQNIQTEKLMFQQKCAFIKEELTYEFNKIITQINDVKESYFAQINTIEINQTTILQEIEQIQEQNIQQVQLLKDDLKKILKLHQLQDLNIREQESFNKLIISINKITGEKSTGCWVSPNNDDRPFYDELISISKIGQSFVQSLKEQMRIKQSQRFEPIKPTKGSSKSYNDFTFKRLDWKTKLQTLFNNSNEKIRTNSTSNERQLNQKKNELIAKNQLNIDRVLKQQQQDFILKKDNL